jgi:uncharacterized membrane protein
MTNIHPFLVHFPIALLTFAMIVEVLALVRGREEWSRVGWWSQVGGTVGIVLAVVSGLRAEGSVVISATAQDAFASHESLAFISTAAFAALLLWRIGTRTRIPAPYRGVYLTCLVGAVVLLWIVGLYGGELVFRYGTGVVSPSGL